MKMNPVIKQQVLTALRSGEYKEDEARTALLRTKDDCYCVMGVVADVVEPGSWCDMAEDIGGYRHGDGGSRAMPTSTCLSVAGLSKEDARGLIHKFDLHPRMNFTQLADHIEEHY